MVVVLKIYRVFVITQYVVHWIPLVWLHVAKVEGFIVETFKYSF